MTNIIIRRDRARATASVYLDGYPATPTWNARYKGPVWKPGDFSGTFAIAEPVYPSAFFPGGGYGGMSRAKLEQMGNPILVLESTYDVQCWDSGSDICLPDVTLKAYSRVDLDTIFLVSGGCAEIEMTGPTVPSGPGQAVQFIVYNLTDGTVLTNSTQGVFSLHDDHVYRLRAHTFAEGYGDLTAGTPSLVQIRFIDAVVQVPGAPEG